MYRTDSVPSYVPSIWSIKYYGTGTFEVLRIHYFKQKILHILTTGTNMWGKLKVFVCFAIMHEKKKKKFNFLAEERRRRGTGGHRPWCSPSATQVAKLRRTNFISTVLDIVSREGTKLWLTCLGNHLSRRDSATSSKKRKTGLLGTGFYFVGSSSKVVVVL